VAWEDPE
jgi:hypothetical protein